MAAIDTDTLPADEAEAFRARCRAFLDDNVDTPDNSAGSEPPDDPDGSVGVAEGKAFQAKLADAGLAGMIHPKEYGGAGLTAAHEKIWREEAAKSPPPTAQLTISHGMCMPMLSEYGTDEQKARFLADNISAKTLWCQMFSEPGAGSDVASLQTRAVLDGDEWTLNGQKVWTTLAHLCDYGVIIARTDPSAPKHRGISMFIVDMNAPGVEIRRIRQIDGGARFNEIFFTDVRIPKSWQLGPLNEGWRLATAMLMYERVAIGTGQTSGIRTPRYDTCVAEAQRRGSHTDPTIRQGLMDLYTREVCMSLVAMRTRAELQAGRTPGPGGSLGKLAGAMAARCYRDLSMRIVGADGQAWAAEGGEEWAMNAIGTLSSGIAGGTNEIQRNIIGDRVLGLPREPSVDKDTPFNDLKVGTQP
ncbi:MAG: dehydrogenase [Actinomycetia bacterium]|nr:dehydrogenase [Actinomycetes bacterium]